MHVLKSLLSGITALLLFPAFAFAGIGGGGDDALLGLLLTLVIGLVVVAAVVYGILLLGRHTGQTRWSGPAAFVVGIIGLIIVLLAVL